MAHSLIEAKVKPNEGEILTCIRCHTLFNYTAATIITLFSDPRPALPSQRFPQVAIDDATRLAYVEVLPYEQKATTIQFPGPGCGLNL